MMLQIFGLFRYHLFCWNWKFIIENIVDKCKVSWNNTVRLINSTKKCSKIHEYLVYLDTTYFAEIENLLLKIL